MPTFVGPRLLAVSTVAPISYGRPRGAGATCWTPSLQAGGLGLCVAHHSCSHIAMYRDHNSFTTRLIGGRIRMAARVG